MSLKHAALSALYLLAHLAWFFERRCHDNCQLCLNFCLRVAGNVFKNRIEERVKDGWAVIMHTLRRF